MELHIVSKEILSVENLKIHFPLKRTLQDRIKHIPTRTVKAVDGVSFSINEGETFGIVGESGSGKTTVGKGLVQLNPLTEGHIYYKGKDITKVKDDQKKTLCKEIQYIFQDPFSSLNPQMTVMQIVRRPLDIFDLYSKRDRERRVLALLAMVGIASNQVYRFPHEFSGGQRQRISIARALAVEPSVLIADEPTSALDVSIQCQILDLLTKLRNELGLTIIFISHDLGVINHITDRVAVMYLGHIIERGGTLEVFKNPSHPYTQALLEALPIRASTHRIRRIRLEGYIPSPINPPKGCLLHPRCPYAQHECAVRVPEWEQIGTRSAACHYSKTQDFRPKTLVM
jgi:oligopeptide/dipeptide ABC transporter ATP-binding protein